MKKPVIIRFTNEHSWREKLLLWLLGKVIPMHAFFYEKRKPWGMRTQHLLQYPNGSLGKELGIFLTNEKLQPIPRVERHDAFHILLDFDTKVHNEAAMQFFLIGNGKISPFTLGTAIFSGLILPENWSYFKTQYYRGKKARNISKWDFKALLKHDFMEVKEYIFHPSSSNPELANIIASKLTK
jgi:ubiquinone biosynthesis protein Coq4